MRIIAKTRKQWVYYQERRRIILQDKIYKHRWFAFLFSYFRLEPLWAECKRRPISKQNTFPNIILREYEILLTHSVGLLWIILYWTPIQYNQWRFTCRYCWKQLPCPLFNGSNTFLEQKRCFEGLTGPLSMVLSKFNAFNSYDPYYH